MSVTASGSVPEQADVVVVGAGFAGMYLLKLMRDHGFKAVCLEQAGNVGGTWYWNRYPGARCDVESIQYSHKYLPELEQEWDWSERYATQPEILAYANEIADRLDIRSDVCFELFEILPRLNPGVMIHFHDIQFPFEYNNTWIFEYRRSWNEIYALRAFLMFNSKFRIHYFNHYFGNRFRKDLEAAYGDTVATPGGGIWLEVME